LEIIKLTEEFLDKKNRQNLKKKARREKIIIKNNDQFFFCMFVFLFVFTEEEGEELNANSYGLDSWICLQSLLRFRIICPWRFRRSAVAVVALRVV